MVCCLGDCVTVLMNVQGYISKGLDQFLSPSEHFFSVTSHHGRPSIQPNDSSNKSDANGDDTVAAR